MTLERKKSRFMVGQRRRFEDPAWAPVMENKLGRLPSRPQIKARFPEPHTQSDAGLAGLRGNAPLLGESASSRVFWALNRVLWTHQGHLKARGRGASRSVAISSWNSNVWQKKRSSPVLMFSLFDFCFWEEDFLLLSFYAVLMACSHFFIERAKQFHSIL